MATDTDEVRVSTRSRVRMLSRRVLVVVGFAAAGWAIGAGAAQAAAPDALGQVTGPVTDILGVSGSSGNAEESAEDTGTTETTGTTESTQSTDVVGDAVQDTESVAESATDQAPSVDSGSSDSGSGSDATETQSDAPAPDAGGEDATTTPEPVTDVATSAASTESDADTNDTNDTNDAQTHAGTEAETESDPGPPVVGEVTDTASRTLGVRDVPAETVRGVDGLLTTVVTPTPTRAQESDSATEASSDDGSGSVTSALLRTAGGAVTGVTDTLRGTADTLESSEVLRPVTEIGSGLSEVVRDTTGADTSHILGGVDTSLREAIDIPAGLVEATYSARPNADQVPTPHVVSSQDSVSRSADREGQRKESQKSDAAVTDPSFANAPTPWTHGQQQVGSAPVGSGSDGSDRGERNDAAQGSGSAVTSAGSSPVAAAGFLVNRVDLAADSGLRLPSTNGEVPVVADAADDPSFSPD
ncbi:hypothetical protein J4H86_19025 [Spiractinospora alimapuensis]|uniref:hypothetical protein n=1 Tax=Spiractinospora alimapuensis TaxID=2820884 RepID=UPI001F45C88C|nr:hypothetical protein [Spiractinospora alimapuensis]QVQ50934.1 hypothetical protein J4H86_19025 [Spiractinospora alimapuensis]